jgi:hypothetical protein
MGIVILIASAFVVIVSIILLGDTDGSNNGKKTPRKYGKTINNTRLLTRRDLAKRSTAQMRQLARASSTIQRNKANKASKEKNQ